MLAITLAAALAGCGTGTSGASDGSVLASSIASGSTVAPGRAAALEAPCGDAGAQAAARAMLQGASRIYSLELQSREVRADQREVAGYEPLLRAVAAGDRRALEQAVTHLVYSHTHIVRLRIERHGRVLYDLGGAYSIAPVAGALRFGGHPIGSYVLSVQDDVGYVKLETRYLGAPLLLREGARPVPIAGMIQPGKSAIPAHGPVDYRGHSYEAISFDAENLPGRRVQVTLLVPVPPAQLSCRAITLLEMRRITETTWHRFVSISAPPSAFVKTAASLTGALTFVREGSRTLAGSNSPGPRTLPSAGTVSYRGTSYSVTSFAAGNVRVYALLPA